MFIIYAVLRIAAKFKLDDPNIVFFKLGKKRKIKFIQLH